MRKNIVGAILSICLVAGIGVVATPSANASNLNMSALSGMSKAAPSGMINLAPGPISAGKPINAAPVVCRFVVAYVLSYVSGVEWIYLGSQLVKVAVSVAVWDPLTKYICG